MGIAADCHVPVDLTTFAMDVGEWNMAVSYISPVYHNIAVNQLSVGLVLECDTFNQEPSSRNNIIAYLNRSFNDDLEEKYFGYRSSIKPANSDTVGIPIRSSIDRKNEIHLRLLSGSGLSTPTSAKEIENFVVCLTFYRRK